MPIVLAIILLPYMSVTAYANSSWHWLTKNPLTILPWAVLITLIIEILAVIFANHIQTPVKTSIVIMIANAISFLFPYIFVGLVPEVFSEGLSFFDRIHYTVNKFPFFIVGIAFLLLTLMVEIAFVYNFLKKNVANKKRLMFSIIAVNCVTTSAVAIIERILSKGRW